MPTDINSRKLIPVGIVLALIGTVMVVGVDGVKRILGLGDKLNQGDNLASGENGGATIGFADGSSITLGPNGEAVLDSDVFDLSAFGEGTDISELLQDMQAAILAGQDPSAVLKAAAAGELSNSEGNTTHVRVANDAQDPDAAVSYETESESGGQGSSGYQMPEGADVLASAGVVPGDDTIDDDHPGNDDPGNDDPGGGGPGGGGPDGVYIEGTSGVDNIHGGGGDDTLLGMAGADTLEGRAGDDFLDGGGGSDLLAGQMGNDQLLGGGGADVFKFTNINEGVDTILDLNVNQDKIDISDLLDGYDPLDSTDDITNWVRVVESSETPTNPDSVAVFDLHVDKNGGGDDFSQIASVEVLSAGLGSTAPTELDIFDVLITTETVIT